MRTLLSFSAAILLTFATSAFAQNAEDNVDPYSDDVLTEEIASTDDQKQQGWNRWICEARASNYYWQSFWGASYYFRAGSGEGQNAQAFARLVAIRECEFRTGLTCQITRQSDCEVRRF